MDDVSPGKLRACFLLSYFVFFPNVWRRSERFSFYSLGAFARRRFPPFATVGNRLHATVVVESCRACGEKSCKRSRFF